MEGEAESSVAHPNRPCFWPAGPRRGPVRGHITAGHADRCGHIRDPTCAQSADAASEPPHPCVSTTGIPTRRFRGAGPSLGDPGVDTQAATDATCARMPENPSFPRLRRPTGRPAMPATHLREPTAPPVLDRAAQISTGSTGRTSGPEGAARPAPDRMRVAPYLAGFACRTRSSRRCRAGGGVSRRNTARATAREMGLTSIARREYS